MHSGESLYKTVLLRRRGFHLRPLQISYPRGFFPAEPGLLGTMASTPEIWVQSQGVRQALVYLHYSYPMILLLVFFASFMVYSICIESEEETLPDNSVPKGPGGKPLPKKKQPKRSLERSRYEFSSTTRAVFDWLTVGVILTFLADAALICIHALVDRKDNWWCGKPVAVNSQPILRVILLTDLHLDLCSGFVFYLLSSTDFHYRH